MTHPDNVLVANRSPAININERRIPEYLLVGQVRVEDGNRAAIGRRCVGQESLCNSLLLTSASP
jgi:hypothetical protein